VEKVIIRAATERTIVFRAENVRAIIAGRKTQARRLVSVRLAEHQTYPDFRKVDGMEAVYPCPYGGPGDHLWVRETIRRAPDGRWRYEADDRLVCPRRSNLERARTVGWSAGGSADVYPANCMPPWARRLVLEITDVRLQRLQDITIHDALAEGPPCWECDGPIDGVGKRGCACFNNRNAARASFVMLWERTHADTEPWASNPWVWAITFQKHEDAPQSR
jgi:hypothetical protein